MMSVAARSCPSAMVIAPVTSMKLTLRDLFWLALFIASLTVWVIEHRKAEGEISDMRRPSWFIRIGEHEPRDAERKRLAVVKRLALFTDQQLDEYFASLSAADQYHHAAEYEPCLAEMARRDMSAQLQKHYDELLARDRTASRFPADFPNNLELLTALRRSQNKPDPLRMNVELSHHWPYGNKEPAPTVRATITNLDVGMEAVRFAEGMDDRGGRRERWRMLLTDEQGRPVADSNFNPMMGGGIGGVGPLEYGKTGDWTNVFDLRRYVAPPRSGKYQLQVFYHNEVSIAGEQDLTGLIVSKSEPIWVTVHNQDEAEARHWPLRPHPALAILAACGLLIASSLIRPASPSRAQTDSNADAQPTASRSLRIARRDLCWGVLIVVVALGFWLDHRRQERRFERSHEDAKAMWTITSADSPQGPS